MRDFSVTMITIPDESGRGGTVQMKYGEAMLKDLPPPPPESELPRGPEILLGTGIFCWCSTERTTNRYGGFFLSEKTLDGSVSVANSMNTSLSGERLRVFAQVRESRVSGHIGDRVLGVGPTRPRAGERVELGVGVVTVEPSGDLSGENPLHFVLRPDDGRRELWMDPRALYRLHDQTVDVFAVRA